MTDNDPLLDAITETSEEPPKKKRGRPKKKPDPVATGPEKAAEPEATEPVPVPEKTAPKPKTQAEIPDHYWSTIQGWCKYHLFYGRMVAEAEEGAKFVEVGSWKGQSAAYMGVEILKSGKNIEFTCIDHFKGSEEEAHQADPEVKNLEAVFTANMKPCVDAGLNLTVLKSDSEKAADKFKDGSLDFVFLDAGHDYATVRRDIEAWLPKVRVGGIIGGDDYPMNGVGEAVREVLGPPVQTEKYDGWTYWFMTVAPK